MGTTSFVARILRVSAKIEPHEAKAVVLSFLLFAFILGSYYILRPVRDALGTVYGVENLHHLFTATSIGALIAAPVYGAFASKIRLSTFLPWVYGFFILTILGFYALFSTTAEDRWVAAAFYVWVSIFNLFITSVFWSLMADMFSRTQGKRLFGVIAAGGSVGAIVGPALTALLAETVGTNTLLLFSSAGFGVVIAMLIMLEHEKARVADAQADGQKTTLERELGGNLFDGFKKLAQSKYLLLIAAFVVLLSWVSTILYFQQADLISQAFESREARTRAFATVDLVVNACAILVQLFGTSRLAQRYGLTTVLTLAPFIMMVAFAAVAVSPALIVLLVVQGTRRVLEYAVTRPGREMLFTVVDQESKYKAKNVIDTVVYRFGDVSSAWVIAGLKSMGAGHVGIAGFGILVCIVWGWLGFALGRQHEGPKSGQSIGSLSGS